MRLAARCIVPVFAMAFAIAGCSKPAPEPAAPAPSAPETPAAQPAPAAPEAKAEPAGEGENVTVYRDTWGVPHIYAKTEAGAAYGLGYCMAEDRLEEIFMNVRTAIGRMSEIDPAEDNQQTDYFMGVLANEAKCEEWYNGAPHHLKVIADGFAKGINAFVEEHPEKKSEAYVEFKPWHGVAVGRTMILTWPIGTIMDDLKGSKNFNGFASNEWAVSPSRSADGRAILLTDPHLTWEGLQVFYEAHVHGGAINTTGFHILGSPVVGLGHNEYVGWTATTGGPDTSDVFALKLGAKKSRGIEYEYDGKMVQGKLKLVEFKVKGQEKPVQKPAIITEFGPLMAEPDYEKGVAYAGVSPYFDSIGLFEQQYAMVTSKSADGFYAALGQNQFMEQNVMYADRDGNIGYVRTGRVPIRPDGYKWDAPVPAHTSASKWLGIHDIADLVQIKNPPQGYMQNCNISPANMMKDSPMTPEKYKDYIYNVSWDSENNRSRNAKRLLEADDSITVDEAIAIAMNVYDILGEPWKAALKTAVDSAGADKMKDPIFAAGVNDILAWNCEFTKESTAAALTKFWRLKCQDGGIDVEAIANGTPLSAEQNAKMLDLLAETQAEFKTKWGKDAVQWGETFVVGRGGKYFPAVGCDFGGGPNKSNQSETLLDVSAGREVDDKGRAIANNGSMSMVLMFFSKDGVESYTCYNWGQSGDPNSPHYVDQTEKLYTQQKMKPSWSKLEDVVQNKESERTLSFK